MSVYLKLKNLIVITGFFLFSLSACKTQEKSPPLSFEEKINRDREDKNKKFKEDGSPIPAEERADFAGLNYFPANEKYKVKAKFVRTPGEKPFVMKTTTDRLPVYTKFGEVHFEVDGKKLKLSVYVNVDLSKKKQYKDYLFMPFTDLTNGEETYDTGRFMEMYRPKDEYITIDFNLAYNPYCAYGDNFSCPITPLENHLDFRVEAGEKKYKETH